MSNFKGIVDISNEEYHAEKEHVSSSNLKSLLKDPEEFYNQKILGQRPEYSKSTLNAFDEGTYAHSLILEPEKVKDEFRFFEGWKKQGAEWDYFKSINSNFIILSKPQKVRVEKWVEAFKELPSAVNLIEGGYPEKTLFGDLMGVPVKVRADYINVDCGYIADVKTTSSLTDLDSFKYTIDRFNYDLSAALYLMMFEKYYKKSFDFYFIVLGKRETTCDVYKLSKESRSKGESLVNKALSIYKKCKKTGIWTSEEAKSKKISLEDYEILEV